MMNFEVMTVSPDVYQQYLSMRAAGQSTPEALKALGLGKDGYAQKTVPFSTDRTKRSAS
jgi:cytochrome c oxidase subunit 2